MPGTEELGIKYIDTQRGLTHHPVISYGNLTQQLRDEIDAVDLTEHELLDRINLTLDRIILHLEVITGEEFTVEDVMEWL